MAHKTKVGGTTYEVKSGKTKVGGTTYDIKSGKTKVGGTTYDIQFYDLTGTSWKLNTNAESATSATTYNVNFTVYSYGYETIVFNANTFYVPLCYIAYDTGSAMYMYTGFTRADYHFNFGRNGTTIYVGRVIEISGDRQRQDLYADPNQYFTITGGADATNPTFCTWIQNNCTRIS